MASAHPTTTTVAPSSTSSSKLASTVSGTVDTKVGAVSMVTARTQSSPCSASRRGVTAATTTTTTLAHNDVRLSAPPKKKALAFQSLKPRRSSKRLLQHRSSRRMRAPDSPSLTQKHQHQQPPSAGPKAACAAAVTAADATPSPATPPAQQRKARSTGDRRQRLSLDSATLSGGSTSSAGAAGGGRRLTTPDRHITLGPVIQAGAHGQVCFGFRRHNASPRRATVPNGRGRSRGRDHGRGAGPDAGAIAAAAVAAHNDGTASSGAVATTTTKSTKSTKSTVAVKIGHGFNPESSQRTQWEALLLSSLLPRHPNLIAIPKGLGPSKCLFSGDVFLPLELADTDLLEFILKAPRFPAAAVRAMLHQLASVIAHLHANGVTHMDIKPDNVLLEFHTGDKDNDDATRGGVFSSPSATTSRSDASSEYSPVASPSATAAAVDKIANNNSSSSCSATANPAIDSNLIHVPGVEPFRLILTDLGMAFRSTTEWPIKAAGVAGSACYAAPEVWTSGAGEDAARLIGLPAQPQAQAGAGAGAGAGTPPVLPSVASTSSSEGDGKQSSSEEEADNDNDNSRRGRRRSRRRRRASGERSPIVEPNVYNAVSADMWSLGAVLFTLMHRHPPWASATTNDPYYRGALETGWFDKRGMHEAPTPQSMDLEPKRPRGRGRSTVHMPATTTTDPSPSPMRPEDGYASSSSSDSSNCAADAAPPADRDPVLHAVLHGLLRLRPEERWSATRVLAYLDSQQALTSSTAVPSHAGAPKHVVSPTPTPAPATTPTTVAVAPTPAPAPAPVVAALSLEAPLSARVPIAGRRAATPRPSPPATCRLPPASREPKLSAYRLQLAALRVDTPRVVIRF